MLLFKYWYVLIIPYSYCIIILTYNYVTIILLNYVWFCTVTLSEIVTQPIDTSAAAPFSGVFICSVSGFGYQNITWHKQSGMLPYKHKTSEITSHGVSTSTLIIPNVTEEDVGKYYCLVWANNRGVRSKTANLFYSGMFIDVDKYW